MDQEIKDLLQKNVEVSQQTLALLQKMRKEVVWGRYIKAVKWVIIISLVIFGFIQIQPFLMYWVEVFNNTSENIEKFNNFFPR